MDGRACNPARWTALHRPAGLLPLLFLPLFLTASAPAQAGPGWLDPGPYAWGHRHWQGAITLQGVTVPWQLFISYPADEPGADVPFTAEPGGFPVVFFQHAGGSDYDWYDDLFARLASHGIVLVSMRHDHDPGWSGGGSFDAMHVDLFRATMDRAFAWHGDPTSFLHGRLDAARIGLAGHSHGAGAALMLMTTVPDLPYDIRSMSLIAPCPLPTSLPLADYPEAYAALPPLQVVYGSKDQDGCVAFGQAIAVYETRERPRQHAHVVGASHHVFDDFGAIGQSEITRADAARALAATVVPFHRHLLLGETDALPALRGDLRLDWPEVRLQFHDVERLVIDDAEGEDGGVPSGAIVGRPGQSFVNGFLSDTFVDFAAGVELVRTQIQALVSGTACGHVLFFEDDALGPDVYAAAIAAEVAAGRLCPPVTTSDRAVFAALLPSDDWDLVIAANQNGTSSQAHPFDTPLRVYIAAGGRAIVSDFRIHAPSSAAMLAAAGATYDGTTNWTELTSTGALFAGTLELANPGWGIATYGLRALDGATVEAVNEIVLGAHDPAVNALGLPVTHDGPFVTADESHLLAPGRTLYQPTWGLELAWDALGARMTQSLAPHQQEALDARPWQVLSFRVAQVTGDPLNPPGAALDCHVGLADAAGRTARVPLSAATQGALQPAPPPATGVGWKSILETYRLDLDLFVDAEPALDLGALVSVAFELDGRATGRATGRIVLDDIELAGRTHLAGDVTGDGVVDIQDVLAVLAGWGACATHACPADVDGDGTVGVGDLLLVLGAWT